MKRLLGLKGVGHAGMQSSLERGFEVQEIVIETLPGPTRKQGGSFEIETM